MTFLPLVNSFFMLYYLSTQVKTLFAIARNVTGFREISHFRARSLLLREITPLRARSSHFARDCTQIRLPSFSEKYLHLKRARFCVVSFVSLEVAKKQVRLQLVAQNTPVIQRNCARNGAKTNHRTSLRAMRYFRDHIYVDAISCMQ